MYGQPKTRQQIGHEPNEDERFDIDFALMTGETSQLFKSLVSALGESDS